MERVRSAASGDMDRIPEREYPDGEIQREKIPWPEGQGMKYPNVK